MYLKCFAIFHNFNLCFSVPTAQAVGADKPNSPLSYNNGTAYTFTWKDGRRLATATKGGVSYSFTYNDEGIRTSKTVGGVKHNYTLEGTRIVSEQWSNKLIIYLYDEVGAPMGMLYRTNSYAEDTYDIFYFEKNLQGDIIAIYNASGTKLVGYTYDAWGNCTTTYYNGGGSTAAQYNPFRYRGYYYDDDLGFYYLNSRYYDPNTGRFINADRYVSTNQGLISQNLYIYCNNNPIIYTDSFGENAETIGWWAGTMWWLCCADTVLPIGDIIYGGILLILAIETASTMSIPDLPTLTFDETNNIDSNKDKSKEGHKLPTDGEPNSDQDLHDENGKKQTRHYGPDGKAEYDIDYRHPNSDNTHKFPHKHTWDWSNPNKPIRSEPINFD